MKKKNIFKSSNDNLQIFSDERGVIADIFYKEKFQHAAFIQSKPNVIRGNHYHKFTTQHMIITKGSMEYWYKNYNSESDSKMIILEKGDLVTTPPLEIHALKIGPYGNEFIVFTEGLRGGLDYEKDTYRVPTIIK